MKPKPGKQTPIIKTKITSNGNSFGVLVSTTKAGAGLGI